MSWLQVSIRSTATETPRIESLLEELGAVSVTLLDAEDEPVLEPDIGTTPLWSDTLVVALFPVDTTTELLHEQLAAAGVAVERLVFEELADRDWEREWMAHFQPTRFGQRLWIVPSWAAAPEPDAINLLLDPGLAFGTGTHPTTALCLTWLDRQHLAGLTVLDFGCGSGILAIAALLLGAARALATDIDPQALEATAANGSRNDVRHLHCLAPADLPSDPVDIVIANILANPLLSLAADLAARVRPGGRIALSGILAEQAASVTTAYAQWFAMDEPENRDGWVLLSGVRHGSEV